jgi:hypothetical protein
MERDTEREVLGKDVEQRCGYSFEIYVGFSVCRNFSFLTKQVKLPKLFGVAPRKEFRTCQLRLRVEL